MLIRFFLALGFISGAASAAPVSFDYEQIALDPAWINQLQYEKTLFGKWKSDAAEASFFISPVGRENPIEELRAEFELFRSAPETRWGYIQQPVVCAFPTRKKFIEEHFFIKIKNVPCAEFEEWRKPFLNSKLVLVFSDSFPNNPASMFGHTFLLFSRHEPYDSAEGLMDYAVNFSADTTKSDEESMFYSIRGLLGGYKARYRMSPFYLMANRYTNWDSRDLWYLPLNLNDEEVQRVVEHIWEIFTNTSFDYYFFTKNCSYRLLTALDYARPTLHLHEGFNYRFPIYYVSPISTLKAVSKDLKNGSESYTPSIRKSLVAQIRALDHDQLQKYKKIRNDFSLIDEEKDIAVLDALIRLYDYQKQTASSNYLSSNVLERLDQSIRRRAKIHEPSPDRPKPPMFASPLSSHLNRSFWISAGTVESNQAVALIGAKAGYHDLLSPHAGYMKWSHLNFIESEFQQKIQGTLDLKKFSIVNLISFFPLEHFDFKPSWRVEVAYDQEYKNYLKPGVGLSWETESEASLFYVFLNPMISSHQELTRNYGVLAELEAGVVIDFAQQGKLWIQQVQSLRSPAWQFQDSLSKTKLQGSYYLNMNNEIRISIEATNAVQNTLVTWVQSF